MLMWIEKAKRSYSYQPHSDSESLNQDYNQQGISNWHGVGGGLGQLTLDCEMTVHEPVLYEQGAEPMSSDLTYLKKKQAKV